MALKEKALRRLADKLNAAGVCWAAAGDWMLTQIGAGDVYHQFDIIVAEKDLAAADKVMSRLGMKSEHPDEETFHCDYHFDGADISMRTPWKVNGCTMQFDAVSIAQDVNVLGAAVHLLHAEDWYVLSSLAGDAKTADKLAAWFAANGVKHPERFAQAVAEPLPDTIKLP